MRVWNSWKRAWARFLCLIGCHDWRVTYAVWHSSSEARMAQKCARPGCDLRRMYACNDRCGGRVLEVFRDDR